MEKNGAIEMTDIDKSGELAENKTLSPKNEYSSLIAEPADMSRVYTVGLVVSWLSLLFSFGTGVAGICIGALNNSESLFAYGIDALLDSISSIAVVWRFQGADYDSPDSSRREHIACVIIGALFLVSASSLITKAVIALLTREREDKSSPVLYESFALTCALISIVIGVSKIYLGHRLKSKALTNDSVITLVGAIVCIAGVVSLMMYMRDSHLWYMDCLFGLLCGIFLFGFGAKLLYELCRDMKK